MPSQWAEARASPLFIDPNETHNFGMRRLQNRLGQSYQGNRVRSLAGPSAAATFFFGFQLTACRRIQPVERTRRAFRFSMERRSASKAALTSEDCRSWRATRLT